MHTPQEWLIAYLITCAVEIPIVIALTRYRGWRSTRFPTALALAWLLQVTHPLLWLIPSLTLLNLVLAEIAIVAVEGAVIAWWAIRRTGVAARGTTVIDAIVISLIANGSSVLVGAVISLVGAPT